MAKQGVRGEEESETDGGDQVQISLCGDNLDVTVNGRKVQKTSEQAKCHDIIEDDEDDGVRSE